MTRFSAMSSAYSVVVVPGRRVTLAPPVIGEFWGSQGGYYAGDISITGDEVATHSLVVSPRDLGDVTGYSTTQPLPTSLASDTLRIDGPGNTDYLFSQGSAAAIWVKGLTINGFTDWYLPARDELLTIYYNLKPSTNNNITQLSQGSLYFGVPKRTQYPSTTDPGQTSAPLFQTGAAQAFDAEGLYNRSETQISGNITPLIFSSGSTTSGYNLSVANLFRWRAIRRVPL